MRNYNNLTQLLFHIADQAYTVTVHAIVPSTKPISFIAVVEAHAVCIVITTIRRRSRHVVSDGTYIFD